MCSVFDVITNDDFDSLLIISVQNRDLKESKILVKTALGFILICISYFIGGGGAKSCLHKHHLPLEPTISKVSLNGNTSKEQAPQVYVSTSS